MIREELGVYLAVISHKRPDNVRRMADLVGPATWFVGAGEADAYSEALRTPDVIEGGALCASRNAALREAWARGVPCVELSDDLTKVQLAVSDASGKIVAKGTTFAEAVKRVREAMEMTGAKLGGAAPTANPFYANVERPVHPAAFIVGDFIVVDPCDLFFDERMTLKEDYDYTLQHFTKHGAVARRDDVLMAFQHRTNPGGACSVRTAELEQANIDFLKKRWPAFIADNPRRPNEILLKMPRAPRLGS